MHRYYFSAGQQEHTTRRCSDDSPLRNEVLVNGKWEAYTQWTSSNDGKCPWKDAHLVAESETELPLRLTYPKGKTGYYGKDKIPFDLL